MPDDHIAKLEKELALLRSVKVFDLIQMPKRRAHIAAMKEAGIWPRDLDLEELSDGS